MRIPASSQAFAGPPLLESLESLELEPEPVEPVPVVSLGLVVPAVVASPLVLVLADSLEWVVPAVVSPPLSPQALVSPPPRSASAVSR